MLEDGARPVAIDGAAALKNSVSAAGAFEYTMRKTAFYDVNPDSWKYGGIVDGVPIERAFISVP